MVAKIFIGIGAVGLAIGLLAGFGVVPLAVTCTTGCGGWLAPSFVVAEDGYTANMSDASHWTAEPSGGGLSLSLSVGWGDGTPSSVFSPSGESVKELPVSYSFTHTYVAAGTYTISETVRATHTQCSGGRGGVHCFTTTNTAVAQGEFAFSGVSGQNKLVPSFTYVTSGVVVTIQDTTTSFGSPTITSIVFAWGDGTIAKPTSLGFSLSHTYAAKGSFTATETTAWTYLGEPFSVPYTVSIPAGCASCTNKVVVNPSFNAVIQNSTVVLTDTTTTVGSPTITGFAVSWGDGTTNTSASPGFTVDHAYPTYANYTIDEVVTWTFGGNSYTTNASQSIVIPCVGSCGAAPSVFGWSALIGFLLIGFGAMLIAAVTPLDPSKILGISVAGMVIGAVAGYVAGGGRVI